MTITNDNLSHGWSPLGSFRYSPTTYGARPPGTFKALLQETCEPSSSPSHPFFTNAHTTQMGPYPDFYFAGPDVESPGWYRPGGYHPVHLGDVYCQRYKVINKLGFGTYSTVWLARDYQSTTQT